MTRPKTKRRKPPKRPAVQHPKGRPTAPAPWRRYAIGAAVFAVVAGVAIGLAVSRSGGSSNSTGLPNTPDYHSLLVNPSNPRNLILGTHQGLYVSGDGGRHWRFDSLSGSDAMNLARPAGRTIWLAGHEVFKKSADGGASWVDVRPSGLPGLDIHGLAVDPRRPATLYAALAGQGLYRSADGGRSFILASRDVGGAVMALAVLPDGRILAGDMRQGLLVSRDDGGSWQRLLAGQVIGLAVNPADPSRLVATGSGIALSTDGGRTWRSVLDLSQGAGPVAWSKSNPKVAYVVGFDRTLYRSADSGRSWQAVGEQQ